MKKCKNISVVDRNKKKKNFDLIMVWFSMKEK